MTESRYFKSSEFACKCGCGLNNIDPELVKTLDAIRTASGHPMIIASACRCPEHNKAVGGKPDSAHTKGKAVDIKVLTSGERFLLLKFALAFGIKRIGVGKTFIHCDNDKDLPQKVAWLY